MHKNLYEITFSIIKAICPILRNCGHAAGIAIERKVVYSRRVTSEIESLRHLLEFARLGESHFPNFYVGGEA